MPLTTALWLAILVVLAALFVITVRRMSALVARTRDLERFQRAVESLDRRFDTAIVPLVRGLDETRRHAGNPTTLRAQANEAGVLLDELLAETRSLAVPSQLTPAVTALAGELERAIRAASLVDHGLAAMETPTRSRDLEAQTALKRGALNLRHAKEAFGRVAREVSALRPVDLAAGGLLPTVGAAALTSYPANDEGGGEGRFDPRM